MRAALFAAVLALGVCAIETPASASSGEGVHGHRIHGIIIHRHRVCVRWEIFGGERHCVKWKWVRGPLGIVRQPHLP